MCEEIDIASFAFTNLQLHLKLHTKQLNYLSIRFKLPMLTNRMHNVLK